ncbi:unnamed protein product [Musa acuminata subsp. malaccensis]|uniref:(wild Malaysian banana) hypothetical protein n=1 Tax=Musa acuminata subsp. malaccensis TaxID=214687 RepID=A0A804JQM0_MUSAM|nr:unnamed protein product [Musa acuminata subsp. malaccensis]
MLIRERSSSYWKIIIHCIRFFYGQEISRVIGSAEHWSMHVELGLIAPPFSRTEELVTIPTL